MKTVRATCAHDCPCMCSLLVEAEVVHSPSRVKTPLRRTGPKGAGQFTPISWAQALDEIEQRWKTVIAKDGPLALLGYAYSSHQGQMNRHLPNGLFLRCRGVNRPSLLVSLVGAPR